MTLAALQRAALLASSRTANVMSSSGARPEAAPSPAPLLLALRENCVLTGGNRWHEKRHLAFDPAGTGLRYAPGDTLDIMPHNDPRVVDALLEALGMAADTPAGPGSAMSGLGEALAQGFEVAVASPKFLRLWASLSGSRALAALLVPENTEARRKFLRANHMVDIVRRYPVGGLSFNAILPGLRPLQPRRFSIASSPSADGLVAILSSTLRYRLHGELRRGTVSGYQLPAALPGTGVEVSIEPCPTFHLPDNDTPIIMVGAGTGVAPYRAFIAERRVRGARGGSWLLLGERHRSTDFLYRDFWEAALADGVLTRLDLAFSRDQPERRYVQHLLLEHAREVYDWLEAGATLYVCGDAAGMAPAVHAALLAVIETVGGTNRPGAVNRLRALAADHRYRRSVY
jgi:sulfite reductase (NADPH) flavoprotein alpha-component